MEITGSDLNEGDVIRATADLTQGIESGTSDSDVQMMENGDLYVGDGSNMPEAPLVMGGTRRRPRRSGRSSNDRKKHNSLRRISPGA